MYRFCCIKGKANVKHSHLSVFGLKPALLLYHSGISSDSRIEYREATTVSARLRYL